MASFADNDVVVDRDAQTFTRLDDLLGHVDVRTGRGRVTRGMVMDHADNNDNALILRDLFQNSFQLVT